MLQQTRFLSNDELQGELSSLNDCILYRLSRRELLRGGNVVLFLEDGVVTYETKAFQKAMWNEYPWETIVRLEIEDTKVSRVTHLEGPPYGLIDGQSKNDIKRFESSIKSLQDTGKVPRSLIILNLNS